MSILLRPSRSVLSTLMDMPYRDGAKNLIAAFSSTFPQLKKSSGQDYNTLAPPKTVSTRIKQFCAGVLLVVPIINIIVEIALRFFYCNHFRRAHLVEAHALYCEERDFFNAGENSEPPTSLRKPLEKKISSKLKDHDSIVQKIKDRARLYIQQEYPETQIKFNDKIGILFIHLTLPDHEKDYIFPIQKCNLCRTSTEAKYQMKRLLCWIDDQHMRSV